MKLTLQRTKDFISPLLIDGQLQCLILENPTYAIPQGVYELVLQYSPRFRRVNLRFLNVPNNQGVEFHTGDWYTDSKGCLITGTSKYTPGNTPRVFDSIPAYVSLMTRIKNYIFLDIMAKYDPITVKITNYKGA